MAMEQILDFSQELDIALLDQIVNTMYTSTGQQQQLAQRVLTQLQEHPDAWQRVDQILQKSKNMPTKYIALQILEKTIQTRWKVLPRDQCEGIKNFIVGIIVEVSSDESRFRAEKNYLNKLNLTLVQILKQEWPKNWPTFLPEIISSSKQNITLCENNMLILRYLSEEIFDFSAETMTQAKIKALKQQMCQEFSDIFSLCNEVLASSEKPSLTRATLETLLRFLGWIPLGYIFETNLLQNLSARFLPNRQFSNVALKCLAEIGALSTPSEYYTQVQKLFMDSMTTLHRLVGPELQMAKNYEDASNSDQEFVQNLANFLTGFLGEHLKLVESPELEDALLLAHQYLLQISRIEERELFKVCLEYWTKLVAGLYAEYPSSADAPLNLAPPLQPMRRNRYVQILHDLRIVMIESMVKPEEVLVVETEEGEVIRERQKESDTIVLYKSMREVLVYLTHLDTDDTESTMSTKLARQADGVEWSWSNLNKLCWAIGSISGAMSEMSEKRFLVQIIKDLLGLTEQKRGKDNKAVVASNIMYIVGQYPRFLKAHWKFLKTVLNKLFEFMHESHEGVQDMACDTFIKIANKCRRHFTVHQTGEERPFVEDILTNMPNIIDQLSPGQIQVFYEAMGHMIAAENREQQQVALLKKLFEEPNAIWDRIIGQAGSSLSVLDNQENTRALAQCLKVNNAACTSIGHPFISQFARIYMDMLGLYKAVSEIISAAVASEGVIGTKTPRVRNLRILKKEVLKLVENYISKSEDKYVVMGDCIPPLLEAVLLDYQSNHEQARDAEVLNVMASIVNKMGPLMNDYIPGILDANLDCTLQMISKDFQEYPEHRAGFYALLHAVVSHCFDALLGLPADKFKLVMDSIIWGIKHTMRDIAETSLQTILALLQSVQKLDPSVSSGFYQNYLLMLMQDTFFVLTDTAHKSGFKTQCQILAEIYRLVENNAIQGPLSPQMAPGTSNAEFMRNHTMQLLQGAFPHLQPMQVQTFVMQLFALNQDVERFKTLLKDFLIQLKEFAGEDNAELYIEERELEAATRQKNEFEEALKVPGLVNPHARPEGMED